MFEITLANHKEDLQGILALQKINHHSNLSELEIQQQGFVTCIHSFEQLQRMNNFAKSIIAKNQNKVIAYNLAMTQDCKDDIPILVPMFKQINALTYQGHPLKNTNYIICGQICIAKEFRAQGLFDKLYDFYATTYSKKYPFILTEIVSSNLRSLNAHKRVGFESLKTYKDKNGTNWEIVIWDFK